MILTHLVLLSFFNGAGQATAAVAEQRGSGGTKRIKKRKLLYASDLEERERREKAVLATAILEAVPPFVADEDEDEDEIILMTLSRLLH